MRAPFDWLLVLFAGIWFFLVTRSIVRSFNRGGHATWLVAAMGFLILVGSGGFFGAGLSAMGIVKLPNSFEWPAGSVCGVRTNARGEHVVPLVPSGRVQLYDPNWRFLRGWHVNANGGEFEVECLENDQIGVYAGRGMRHYVFTENGEVVSSANYSSEPSSIRNDWTCVVVPTSTIGWVFSSPFISWAVAVVGFIGLAIVGKLAERKVRH
jgi:hypothetical protein